MPIPRLRRQNTQTHPAIASPKEVVIATLYISLSVPSMNRSLRALRPGFATTSLARPLAPSLASLRNNAAAPAAAAKALTTASFVQPRPQILAIVRLDASSARGMSVRLYTTKGASETKKTSSDQGTSGTATRPSANPHADQQNATSGPIQEVRPDLLRVPCMRREC